MYRSYALIVILATMHSLGCTGSSEQANSGPQAPNQASRLDLLRSAVEALEGVADDSRLSVAESHLAELAKKANDLPPLDTSIEVRELLNRIEAYFKNIERSTITPEKFRAVGLSLMEICSPTKQEGSPIPPNQEGSPIFIYSTH